MKAENNLRIPVVVDFLEEKDKPALHREIMPGWVPPMLAALTHDLRARKGWVYEHKFDGERCMAYRRARKALLEHLIRFPPPLRIAKTITRWTPDFQQQICRKGWEGLIAKDANAPYVSKRARTWLKYKCAMSQAFVIAGFTDPKHSRIGFGALLLGVCDDAGHLHYAGKVGTGFDDAFLRSLRARMNPLEVAKPAFIDPPQATKGVHWLRPQLVGEVGFSELTEAGRLRHPRFLGLRDDKTARDTRQEKAL